MKRSAELMNTDVIDLMQVHNLRDTAVHMTTIREWQEQERIRYSGLTHYTAGAHEALAREMKDVQAAIHPDQLFAGRTRGRKPCAAIGQQNSALPC